MNEPIDQEPRLGDLVRLRWVTRGQKERWVAMSSRGSRQDPDGCGLVIETEPGAQQHGPGSCTVLWYDGQKESVGTYSLIVVQRAQRNH